MYLLREGSGDGPRVQLLGCGAILREVMAGAELLANDWGVTADIWSCPSFTELRREAIDVERWNLLHPTEPARKSYVESCLEPRQGPIVAASDYVRLFADQIRPFVPTGRRYRVLGTDGFGRSDYRRRLRHFFEVDRRWVALAALEQLAKDGAIPTSQVGEAIRRYEIDPEKPNPATV
jgi:pyruvate dehydrogenase E1 component